MCGSGAIDRSKKSHCREFSSRKNSLEEAGAVVQARGVKFLASDFRVLRF